MTEWIRDRRPTRADGNENGLVLVHHVGLKSSQALAHWSDLGGAEWRHTSDWTPPTPEPTPAAPEPELEPEPELQPEISELVCDGENRPPLGLRARRLALEERELEIRAVIKCYDDCGLICPPKWLIELGDIKRLLEILKQNPLSQFSQLVPPAPEPEPEPEKATRGFAWFNRVDVNPGHEVEEYAVATDGTAWWRIIGKDDRLEDKKWIQVRPLPQPGEE